jgi:hypothetical protein
VKISKVKSIPLGDAQTISSTNTYLLGSLLDNNSGFLELSIERKTINEDTKIITKNRINFFIRLRNKKFSGLFFLSIFLSFSGSFFFKSFTFFLFVLSLV